MTQVINHRWWGAMLLPALSLVLSFYMIVGADASIIGKDDRDKISLDDEKAVEFALRTPKVIYCGQRSTTGILVRREGEKSDYLLLSAHHLFNGNGKFHRYDSNGDGKITKSDMRCTINHLRKAVVAFNLVYLGSKYGKLAKKAEKNIFDGDPINLKSAKRYLTTGEDVLIIKLNKQISQQVMPHNNKPRGYSKFLPTGNYKIKNLDQKSSNIAFHFDTAFNVMKTDSCKVRRYNKLADPRVSFKTSCDARPGSSNSPVFIEYKQEPAIWGLVISGINKHQPENTKVKNWVSIKTTEFLVKEYGLETIAAN
jgi:hypothetical protein